jgi:ribose transport system substrate-binding protein
MKKTTHLAFCFLLSSAIAIPGCSAKPRPLEKYGNYTLYDTFYDNVDQAKAKDNASDALGQMKDEPKVCMVGLWAYNPPAILSAVEAANKLGKVHIIGFDEDEITLKGIKDGHIHATVVQQPFEFGYQSVKLMARLARDPSAKLPEEARDGVLHVPHLKITRENVEEFHDKLNKLKAEGSAPARAPSEATIKVGFVSNNTAEFWTIAEAGTRKAANELGVEVLFRRPKNADAASQKEEIEGLMSQGVQAIAISVIDPVNQEEFLNKIADRIPLITQDNDAPNTRRKCYIGTDNIAAGREVGKLVKEVMPEGGAIAIFVGQPDPLNAQQRRRGVLDELAGK